MHCPTHNIQRHIMKQAFVGIKELDALSNIQDSQVHKATL